MLVIGAGVKSMVIRTARALPRFFYPFYPAVPCTVRAVPSATIYGTKELSYQVIWSLLYMLQNIQQPEPFILKLQMLCGSWFRMILKMCCSNQATWFSIRGRESGQVILAKQAALSIWFQFYSKAVSHFYDTAAYLRNWSSPYFVLYIVFMNI